MAAIRSTLLILRPKPKRRSFFCSVPPHNPTGRVWNKEELEKLIDISLANGAMIVSDEIHFDIVFRKIHHVLGNFEKCSTLM